MIWSDWENTQDEPRRAVPHELRFDARQYDAALARMAADHSWERPVNTVARLLEEAFCEHGPHQLRNASLVWVDTRSDVSDRVELRYRSPGRPGHTVSGAVVLPLDPSAPPEREAERLTGWLRSADPRELTRQQEKAGVRGL